VTGQQKLLEYAIPAHDTMKYSRYWYNEYLKGTMGFQILIDAIE
jgi:hypothetical protein